MSVKFVSKAVDENGDGLDVERVVQVGNGGTSGIVTDDSDTFRLDNVESEVVVYVLLFTDVEGTT